MSEEEKDKQLDAMQRMLGAYEQRLAQVERELVTALANLQIAQEQIGAKDAGGQED